METLPRRSQTTRTTQTTSIAWIELSSIRTIGTIKPGFHMSGKSQTIGDFTFCGPSQILPIFWIICPRFSKDDMFICDGGLEPRNLGDW